MIKLEEQLISLYKKLQHVARRYQQLENENQHLKKELQKFHIQINEKEKLIELLNHQTDVIKLSKQSFNSEEKKELENRINIYLKDIENCLLLLNA